jgi:putative FmdB family regulatory protein
MPTYEYECVECAHRFDVFQSIKDAPLDTCKKCGGRVRKLISSGAGVIFKGSGFYVTDYKGSPAVSSKNKENAPSASSDACAACKSNGGGCGE